MDRADKNALEQSMVIAIELSEILRKHALAPEGLSNKVAEAAVASFMWVYLTNVAHEFEISPQQAAVGLMKLVDHFLNDEEIAQKASDALHSDREHEECCTTHKPKKERVMSRAEIEKEKDFICEGVEALMDANLASITNMEKQGVPAKDAMKLICLITASFIKTMGNHLDESIDGVASFTMADGTTVEGHQEIFQHFLQHGKVEKREVARESVNGTH